MSYTIQYGLAVGVALVSVATGVVLNANPEALGISPVIGEWLKVVLPILTVAASFLPRVQKPPEEERRGLD